MTYPEIYTRLCYETALVVFLKKNGEVRLMLGTRNLNTVSLLYGFQGNTLGGHDNRCNVNNGNVAIFDMIAGDARSFNIDRMLDIQFAGVISSKEEYERVLQQFVAFKTEYEKTKPMVISMDSFEKKGE